MKSVRQANAVQTMYKHVPELCAKVGPRISVLHMCPRFQISFTYLQDAMEEGCRLGRTQ